MWREVWVSAKGVKRRCGEMLRGVGEVKGDVGKC